MTAFRDLALVREAIKAYEAWRWQRHKDDSTTWRDRVAKGLQEQGYQVKHRAPTVEPGDAKED